MPDTNAGTGADAVFRLIYRSRLTIPTEELRDEVSNILSAARTKNPEQGITGALVVWEDNVVQTLEGDEDAVRRLYDTIGRDRRHEQIELVDTSDGVDRAFGRWSMAWVSDDNDADMPLSTNQWEGGIDVTAPPLRTPDEDAVIASMRDRVRGASA